jgi:queuosine precursor transporter
MPALSNEVLFLIAMFGGLTAALISSYFGRAYIIVLIIAIALYMNIAEARIIEVFGYPTTIGTALYAVIFFANDLLVERYGKKVGLQAVRYALVAGIAFQCFLQLNNLTTAVPEMKDMADAMNMVFGFSLRIFISSMVVYILVQSYDVWVYQRLMNWTKGKHLWLRNKFSTMTAQGIDSYLFYFLAFYGVFDDWFVMATVMYCFKLAVAICDTPYIYVSKMFTPRDLRT